MVLRFTATVKKRAVVVRGVDLPDGAEVDVTIDPIAEPDEDLTPEDLAEIDEALREIKRGEYISGDQLIAELRQQRAVLDQRRRESAARDRARTRALGTSGNRTKSSRRRTR